MLFLNYGIKNKKKLTQKAFQKTILQWY